MGLGAPGFSSPRIVRIAVIAGGSGSSSRLRLRLRRRSRSGSGSGSGHSRTARTLQPPDLKIQNCWAWNEELRTRKSQCLQPYTLHPVKTGL